MTFPVRFRSPIHVSPRAGTGHLHGANWCVLNTKTGAFSAQCFVSSFRLTHQLLETTNTMLCPSTLLLSYQSRLQLINFHQSKRVNWSRYISRCTTSTSSQSLFKSRAEKNQNKDSDIRPRYQSMSEDKNGKSTGNVELKLWNSSCDIFVSIWLVTLKCFVKFRKVISRGKLRNSIHVKAWLRDSVPMLSGWVAEKFSLCFRRSRLLFAGENSIKVKRARSRKVFVSSLSISPSHVEPIKIELSQNFETIP